MYVHGVYEGGGVFVRVCVFVNGGVCVHAWCAYEGCVCAYVCARSVCMVYGVCLSCVPTFKLCIVHVEPTREHSGSYVQHTERRVSGLGSPQHHVTQGH